MRSKRDLRWIAVTGWPPDGMHCGKAVSLASGRGHAEEGC